jgi:hypothetical protein
MHRLIISCLAAAALLGSARGHAQPAALDTRIVKLLESVSEKRLEELLTRLASFETRNTMSTPDLPSGLGAARQWILDEMRASSPRLQVSFDTYRIPQQGERITREVEIRNVMAVLPGRSPRRIYVSGHYDSLARRPAQQTQATPGAGSPTSQARAPAPSPAGFDWARADNRAPGANDDGSGTVLAMELARVFAESGIEFDATLVFIAFAGEEQGLVGAKLHAQQAEAAALRIDAVFNNDIVGNATGGSGLIDSTSVRVFSQGPEDSPSRSLARFIREQAARYVPSHTVRLIARHDRFGRGGDHTAFNQHGFAGVRFTESREHYARQHSTADTIDGVSFPYLARNARVNAAGIAVVALAPPAPSVLDERGRPMLGRQPTGYDANLRWHASPGAAGYRIVWRDSWANDWEHEIRVGSVTAHVLPNTSIDDYVFGVAAVGPDGHESLVSAYVNPPRPEQKIETVR